MLLAVVREQAWQAEIWTCQARGPLGEALLRRTSRYAEFCGWLHQDQRDLAAADEWTRKAIEMSQELGDSRLVAYSLMRRSNIAMESGRAADGLHPADAALRQRGNSDARLVALSMRQKAAAPAFLGEPTDAEAAVERGAAAADLGAQKLTPNRTTAPFLTSRWKAATPS